jgi:hypothetical protein
VWHLKLVHRHVTRVETLLVKVETLFVQLANGAQSLQQLVKFGKRSNSNSRLLTNFNFRSATAEEYLYRQAIRIFRLLSSSLQPFINGIDDQMGVSN